MIEEGTILQERYRIEKQIGQGGMGSVYLATDQRFGSTVAIKETLFTDEHFKKAFKREARLLNSLKHSALPKVSDHFIEDNGQYIVMEYIGGKDLFETLESTGEPFPVDQVLKWGHQLLDALEYLHGQENPVIHRDIKPQNLKITSHDQIVLLDFGLAKGNPTDANHHTAANSIFGYSRNYASLEQIQGTGTDPRSDLFSLAATIYHLVTGSPPADALTRVMMVLNEEKDPLQPASEIHGQVTEVVSDLLLSTMSLNANQRPQSASEMRAMLLGEVAIGSIPRRQTLADSPLENEFFSRKTEVIPGERGSAQLPKTEMKTKVFSALAGKNKSLETKIVKQETVPRGKAATVGKKGQDHSISTAADKPNASNVVVGFLAGLSMIGIVMAAGVYFNPGMFGFAGADATTESIEAGAPNSVPATESVSDVNSVTNETEPDNMQTVESTSGNTVKTDMPGSTKAETKTTRELVKDPVSKKSETKGTTTIKNGEVSISNGKIKTKDATISDGKIETKEILVDSTGVRVRPIPPKPPITREEFERLSPEQKRKVRVALERWRRAENARRKREGQPPLPKESPPN